MARSKTKQLLRRAMPARVYGSAKSLYWSRVGNAVRRARSRLGALRRGRSYNDVETFLLFIGYPRSGHSLVGSLLNAHRNVVVAHELHCLWYVERGFSRNELFDLIWRRDRWFGRHGRKWTEFNYTVPGQWQGRSEALQVIGDKKGDGVTDLLHFYPGLLDAAVERVGCRLRIIHTVRNPYDNVATMARRTGDPLEACIERHRNRTAINAELIERLGENSVLNIRHEELIAEPQHELLKMCDFLGIDAPVDYLSACAGIIYRSPNLSRHAAAWTDESRAAIERIIARTPFLEGYTFAE